MTIDDASTRMSGADHAALADAVRRLERTSLAVRASNALGRRLGAARALVPERIAKTAAAAADVAIRAAMRVALASLSKNPRGDSIRLHKALAAASGAAGGLFGFSSLPIELPISTTIMLRAIADIARGEGENLADPEAALACLEVFALDGRANDAELTEGGYFAVRALLAKTVSEAARYIAARGVADEAAPILVKFMSQVASRFGAVVSQKFVAQAVPAVGAIGGAAINFAFTDHFQSMAKGHFTVRRLERKYGGELVQAEYQRIAQAKTPDEIRAPDA